VTSPLTLNVVFTGWTLDVPGVLAVLLLGGAYLAGVRRVSRRTTEPVTEPGGAAETTPSWPRSRIVAFGVGLLLIFLVTCSFVDRYDDVLFWARATQVIVLLMVVPLCLAMSSPVALALGALSDRGRDRLTAVLSTGIARVLTFPATASLLLVATPWALYFTGWYPAVLANGVVDQLTRLVLLLVGFLYFYSRLQLDPVPHKYPHLISVVITFVEVIFDAALGLVLWLSPHLVAEAHYQALHRTWGPSLHDDQIFGAGVLWLVGDLAGLPFLGALMSRMVTDDRAEAAEIDRHLDEQDELAAHDAEISAELGEPAAPHRMWWEDDPVLAERFRPRDH
jgi:cytochrome c oxidase assembly factor CtaG